ncbi:MAG: lamin tail domain-containing protein [Candidatus Electryoneaceae bacterium]|nr:lamin tail domain-containing protein [Candidatus Electryoneaceae bacterium]
MNSILSNSFLSSIYEDSLSSIRVTYSLSDTDKLPGVGNIFADPLFIYPEIFDLQLQTRSPCIDAGDPSHPLDDDGTIQNIGAYYAYRSDDFPFEIHNSIVINEINYNSAIEFDPNDWVEFLNPTDSMVDMSNWSFKDSDDSHIFRFPFNSILEPKAHYVVCRDSAIFHRLFPDVDNYVGDMNFLLNGAGEMVRLFDDNGVIVDYLVYDDALPWSPEPDGNGPTLELINPNSDNRLSENWSASEANYGTPGRENSVYKDPDAIPNRFTLRQNYPNPFNNTTKIRLELPFDCNVKVKIFDILGREITTIHNGALRKGFIRWSWDSGNLSSGIYFLMVDTGNWHDSIKMVKIE